MIRYASALLAPLLVVACGEDPGGTNTDFGMTTNTADATVAGNLRAVNYDPVSEELVLSLASIHSNERNVTYQRRADLDTRVPGYEVYMLQRSPADRHYTALFAGSDDNEVVAGVVADGGNNGEYFAGGFYGRQGLGVYSPYLNSGQGTVEYYGDYAAVTNVANDGSELLDQSGLPSGQVGPTQSATISGNIQFNVDFANGLMDGQINNREIRYSSTSSEAIPNILLVGGSFGDDGIFTGAARYGSGSAEIGNFAGIFGGNQATSAAGVVYLEEFDNADEPLGLSGEEEYGVFVLTRCGATGDDPGCAGQ